MEVTDQKFCQIVEKNVSKIIVSDIEKEQKSFRKS